MSAGILWAAIAYAVVRRWASDAGWNDVHRWALAYGATLVSMAAGFGGSSAWLRMDIVAKVILNVIAVAGFMWLFVAVKGRSKGVEGLRMAGDARG